jgi:hypothetical protein
MLFTGITKPCSITVANVLLQSKKNLNFTFLNQKTMVSVTPYFFLVFKCPYGQITSMYVYLYVWTR